MGFKVHQLDFPKDNLEETLAYIHEYITSLVETDNNRRIYVLGRSSGGYLAKILFDRYPQLIRKAVYLAPVFNPSVRAEYHPKFEERQKHYFRCGGNIPETLSFDAEREMLFLAQHDENVPRECFTREQLDNAIDLGIKTHKGMTTTTSQQFCDILRKNLLVI